MSAIVLFLSLFTITTNIEAQEDSTDMQSVLFPGLPMQRDGSGTSWLPDSSPMHAIHFQLGKWSAMAHGNVFLRYTDQDAGNSGSRGEEKFDMPNWFMVMARRPIGSRDHVMVRGMFSLDPLTEGGNGYPLLFQSGETWKGKRLIDRQHPHDLFGELAASYSLSIADNSGAFFYFGLPGEPALGPPVYLHRPSAQNNPDAPLGHHWQDSTHVTFGVLTLGYWYKHIKIEGSLFTGREPGENRYNIDKPRFDSYSIRLSVNPSANTALQISHGYLKSPEALEPGIDLHRTTASIIWNYPVSMESNLAASFVWGMNKPASHNAQNSFLLEADYQVRNYSFFTRAEFVEKSAEDLGLADSAERLFSVTAFTLGAARKIADYKNISLYLGALGTVYNVVKDPRPVYGDSPFSVEVFLRLSPGQMKMNHHGMHDMQHGM